MNWLSTNHIQLLIVQKAARIDLAAFEDPAFHNKMRMATNEAMFRPMIMLNHLMTTVSTLTTIVSLAVVVVLRQLWVASLLLLTSLLLGVSVGFGRARVQLAAERAEIERKKQYFSMLLISDAAVKEIRLFNLSAFLLDRFRSLLGTTYCQDRRLVAHEVRAVGGAGAVMTLVQPALFDLAAWHVVQGWLSIGQFSLYIQSIAQLQGSLGQLMFVLSGFHESVLFASSLLTFLALEPEVEAPRHSPQRYPPYPTYHRESSSARYPFAILGHRRTCWIRSAS